MNEAERTGVVTYKVQKRGFQLGILMGVMFLFCCLAVQICERQKEKEILIDTDLIAAEQPIDLAVSGIRRSDIKSCVWYVGETEVSRAEKLISYTPVQEDVENFIRVSVTLKDGSCYEDVRYFSVLPVIYMESDTGYDEVGRDENTSVFMKMAAGKEYLPTELYEGTAQIHLRGNSTSELSKHPFKLKLNKKTNLLGLGETKHWVLLANALDSTLMRNKFLYDFSGNIGAGCQMHSENVTLIYNGEYEGVYEICEQVRIGESSVNVFNWEEAAEQAAEAIAGELVYEEQIPADEEQIYQLYLEEELIADLSWLETHTCRISFLENSEIQDTFDLENYIEFDDLPDATGGVLLEMDIFHRADASLKTQYMQPIYFNKPCAGDTYPELYAYTMEYLQATEYAFHSTDFVYHNDSAHYKVADGGRYDGENALRRVDVKYALSDFDAEAYDMAHYSDLIDFNSLLVNFLVCEVSVNFDGMKNSVFLYKDIDGPFYIGPAWDYDWAWGNSNFGNNVWAPEEWHTTNEAFASEDYYQTAQWNRYLIRDPYFLVRVYERYWEIRDTVIEEMICDGGQIDQYADELRPAAEANDAKWSGCFKDVEPRYFDEELASMKSFIRQRIAWLDCQFADIDTLNASLGYYIPSDSLVVEPADTVSSAGMTEVTVHITDPDCKGISFQVNGVHFYTAEAVNGTASVLIPDSALREEAGALNTVQVRALDADGNYLINPEGTTEGDYTNAVSNFIYFTK